MRASVYYKDTHFMLKELNEMGIITRPNPEKGRYKKYIFFQDKALGTLIYELAEIKELHIYED